MKRVSFKQIIKLLLIYLILDFGSQLLFYVIFGLSPDSFIANAFVSTLPLAFLLYNFEFITRPPRRTLTLSDKVIRFVLYAFIAFVMVLGLSYIMEQLF